MQKVSSWTKREEKQDTPVLNPRTPGQPSVSLLRQQQKPGRKTQPQINLHSATVVAHGVNNGESATGPPVPLTRPAIPHPPVRPGTW